MNSPIVLILGIVVVTLGYLLIDVNWNWLSSVGYIILAVYFAGQTWDRLKSKRNKTKHNESTSAES